jgi:3-deoxy-7-phosphoheptulonate synthase
MSTVMRPLPTYKIRPETNDTQLAISAPQLHLRTDVDRVVEVELVNGRDSHHNTWNPKSWIHRVAAQKVQYPDQLALDSVCQTLHSLPPLIKAEEIERARSLVVEAASGKAFIIQGGDCTESFFDVKPAIIQKKIMLLREQSTRLSKGLGLPVVQFGRIAGQYAKPRSSPFETLPDGTLINAFRGDNVNGFGLHERVPDPQRLLMGYFYAAVTLNSIGHVQEKEARTSTGSSVPLFTAHEALHLPYESALTHDVYNHSAAFVWVGERTRQLDGAHVEYLRGLHNPVGIKVGPKTQPEELVALLTRLSSSKGGSKRLAIITRLGAKNVTTVLPRLAEAVRNSGLSPAWICDPCHGNTVVVGELKTRVLQDMVDEATLSYAVLREAGWFLSGLHLEQTGESVTECIDRHPMAGDEALLKDNYHTLCDPRLSGEQALHVIDSFVAFVQALRNKDRRG